MTKAATAKMSPAKRILSKQPHVRSVFPPRAVKLETSAPPFFILPIEGRVRRSGKVVPLVESSGKAVGPAEPQQHLIRLMYLAHTWREEMQRDNLSASEMAKRHLVDKSYISRVVRLLFLSPRIVEQIVGGEQLHSLNARRLVGLRALPLDWADQERELLAS